MNDWEAVGKMLGLGSLGTVAAGLALRMIASWWKKQNAADNSTDANSKLIVNLQAESKKWMDLHEAERMEHENTKRLITVVQMQNVMLKMMLKERGVSLVDIDAMELQFAPANVGGMHA